MKPLLWDWKPEPLLADGTTPPKPTKIVGWPVFSVHTDSRVTLRKSTSYSEGMDCVAWRGNRFLGMCWIPRGWYIGNPLAGALAYARAQEPGT